MRVQVDLGDGSIAIETKDVSERNHGIRQEKSLVFPWIAYLLTMEA